MYKIGVYEIGLRGTAEEVEKFVQQMRDDSDVRYWAGSFISDTQRSFQRHVVWSESLDIDFVRAEASKWSVKFPDSESFYLADCVSHVLDSVAQRNKKVLYGSYSGGHLLSWGEIDSHSEHVRHFGDDLRCDCENSRADENPYFAPYADCPIRVNPPTKWAVENLMAVSEMLPTKVRR